jgi:hypothetical protein
LAQRHGINPKTVAKWKKRDTTADHRIINSLRLLVETDADQRFHKAIRALHNAGRTLANFWAEPAGE